MYTEEVSTDVLLHVELGEALAGYGLWKVGVASALQQFVSYYCRESQPLFPWGGHSRCRAVFPIDLTNMPLFTCQLSPSIADRQPIHP